MKHIYLVAVLCALAAPRILWAIDEEDGVMSAPTPGSAPRLIDPGNTDLKPDRNSSRERLPDPKAEAEQAKGLAGAYGVSQQTIVAMREQGNMTWSDIQNSLQIARHIVNTADKPVAMDQALRQVRDLRTRGMSYSEIAQHFGGQLAEIKHEDMKLQARIDFAPSLIQPERPETPDRTPDRPEKPDVPEKPESPASVGQ